MFKLNCKLSVTAGTDVAVLCCIMHAGTDASLSAQNYKWQYYGVVCKACSCKPSDELF